jgi:hypothetical protein
MIDLPFIRGGDSNSSSSDDGLLSRLLTVNGIVLSAVAFTLALLLGGALGVPDGLGVQVVVALELLALYLLLHELDAYSFPFFAAVGAITTVLGLSALGEPVIASILNSEVGVILVLGALYLGYRWLKQRNSGGGDGEQTIVVRRGGGGGS